MSSAWEEAALTLVMFAIAGAAFFLVVQCADSYADHAVTVARCEDAGGQWARIEGSAGCYELTPIGGDDGVP